MAPMYDYSCHDCHKTFERFFRIEERKQFEICPECGASAERTISANIQRDDPPWLSSATANLLPKGTDVRPITDRVAYKRYLRDNNIVEAG